ncbi:biliverdin-producing heme oxygenase [Novosphingobium sp. MBES04]|uniref:biliverdin-producing heme oxygenase n=1 Tax=Novosphingobium sp. MBES04 TaxID=1206458 RepID=UPI00057F5C92|nr:biliverdin-producing heme oxygenase [Novosphingobium sp. MBES04]GAM03184.1 heme oxygenase protein [Novosphingobium sp. MBES04]
MLSQLRAVTRASHDRLDAAFGALDLGAADDCARFLAAHAVAVKGLDAPFRRFVEEELDMPCPDFPAMLAADLAERGLSMSALPAPEPDACVHAPCGGAGVAYVIAGSRLGNAVIRAEGYHGRETGLPSRYMEDDTGHAVWKALNTWARARSFGPSEERAVEAAALATFAHFETAFAVGSNMETPRADG